MMARPPQMIAAVAQLMARLVALPVIHPMVAATTRLAEDHLAMTQMDRTTTAVGSQSRWIWRPATL